MGKSQPAVFNAPFQVNSPTTGRPLFAVIEDEHGPLVQVFNQKGGLSVTFGGTDEGGWFTLFNAAGVDVVSLQVRQTNAGGAVIVSTPGGAPAVAVMAEESGGRVSLYSGSREPLASLTTNEAGSLLTLGNPQNEAGMSAGVTAEGANLIAANADGSPGLALGSAEAGGFMVGCDQHGKPRAEGEG